MRILAVHLRNLNSLAGSWTIDFNAPEYATSGIFAITGPTGAGKSTLLDAICLALFGRTPRLGSITKGSNEIMSRRAGDCFAEISFSTNSGQYRCHWGQHRSRRKPGGELQTPRHEIVDLESGKVLESRSREVVRMVEQVTGMDYDRFTRSILLAQGDFAAFLEADADQRAPILEQITGTGIYSRLSIAVHERTSEERKKTAVLQEALGSLKLLSQEEEQEIAAEIGEHSKVAGVLRSKQEQVEKSIQHLAQLETLKKQFNATENELIRLNEQRQEAKADLRRLEQGQRAQTLVPFHTTLLQLQDQIQAYQQKERQRSLLLQTLQQVQQQLQKEHRLALQHLGKSQITREQEQERIKAVRALDLQIHEKNKIIQQISTTVTQLKIEQEGIRVVQEKLKQQLNDLQGPKEELHRFFNEHAPDALLVEQFAGLRQQLLHLGQKEVEHGQLQKALTSTKQQQEKAASQQQQLDHSVEQAVQALHASKQEQQRLQQEREDLLGPQTMAARRRNLTEQENRLQQLERGNEWAKRLQKLAEETDKRKEQGTQLLSRQRHLQDKLHLLEEQHLLRKQLVLQCEKNHQLSLRIRSYEEERERLQEGAPCPLCGSTQHPWSSEKPPTDDRETELAQARLGFEQSQSEIGKNREALAALSRDLEHIAQLQTQNQSQIGELTRQLIPLLTKHDLGPLNACASTIVHALETGRQQTDALRTRLAAIEQVDGKLQALATQIEQAANDHTEATQRAQANRQVLASREQDIRNLDTRLEDIEALLVNAWEDLQENLQPFALAGIPAQSPQAFIKALETRLQRWKAQSARQEELIRNEGQLVSTLDKQDLQGTNLETQIKSQSQELLHLQQQRETLQKQRQELYGELDPNVEEQRLRSLVQQAEASELTARDKLAANEKEVHSLSEQQRLDREELQVLLPKRVAQEAQLLTQVREAEFADLAAFTTAILPAETLQQLDRMRQQLEQQQVLLTTRKEELSKSLAVEEASLEQTKTQPELQGEKETLQQQIEELQQRIGADRERLAVNQRLTRELEAQRLALANQQQELERWELLHHLIGSADGKRFRVFAQGLTFEVMVSHANRQLRKMNDRYILLRDPKEPLALQVIDNYQAGEIRSTRNLSGGESFLVSLALSLGLSAMASHNVRVDSLFLDEGFGTLDEETLDTALQTLAELQQDGKLIGIISHVPLLKERIDLRIQVQPGPDGCSRLLGPGCGQLD
ncbi:MAG: AAA family ATPase [Desulfobulbus sp.]